MVRAKSVGEFVPVDQLPSQRSIAEVCAQVPGIVKAQVTEDYHLCYPGLVCATVEVTNSRGETTEVVTVGDVREGTGTESTKVMLRYIKIEACDQGWGDQHVLKLYNAEEIEYVAADWLYNLRHWAEGLDEPTDPSDLQLLQREELAARKALRDAIVRRVHVGKDVSGLLWDVVYELDVNYSELERLWLDETRHPTPQMVLRKLTDLISCPKPEVRTYPHTRNRRRKQKETLMPQFSANGLWRVVYDHERMALEASTPEALVACLEQHFGQTPREQWLEGARIEAPAQWRWWV